jgi:hypothetical protein
MSFTVEVTLQNSAAYTVEPAIVVGATGPEGPPADGPDMPAAAWDAKLAEMAADARAPAPEP